MPKSISATMTHLKRSLVLSIHIHTSKYHASVSIYSLPDIAFATCQDRDDRQTHTSSDSRSATSDGRDASRRRARGLSSIFSRKSWAIPLRSSASDKQ